MADESVSSTAVIDELASLGPQERGKVVMTLRRLSETFAEGHRQVI